MNLVNTMVNNTIPHFYSKTICNFVLVFVTWIRWFYFILVNFCRQVGDSAVWLNISLL